MVIEWWFTIMESKQTSLSTNPRFIEVPWFGYQLGRPPSNDNQDHYIFRRAPERNFHFPLLLGTGTTPSMNTACFWQSSPTLDHWKFEKLHIDRIPTKTMLSNQIDLALFFFHPTYEQIWVSQIGSFFTRRVENQQKSWKPSENTRNKLFVCNGMYLELA